MGIQKRKRSYARQWALAMAAWGIPSTLCAGADLVWAPPGASNMWDIGTTANFVPLAGGSQVTFQNGDSVTLDDSAAHHTIIFPTNVAMQPARLTVNTTSGYVFAYGGGSLNNGATFTGNMTLVKEGSGTLEMQFENAFTGGAIINAGVVYQRRVGLSPPRMDPLGNGTIIFNGTSGYAFNAEQASLVTSPGAANVEINGDNFIELTTSNPAGQVSDWNLYGNGTWTIKLAPIPGSAPFLPLFTLNGSLSSFGGTIKIPDSSQASTLRFNASAANINVGGSSVTFDLGNGTSQLIGRNNGASYALGALTGGVNTSVGGNGSSSTFTIGEKGINTTYQGSIVDADASKLTNVIKSGSASLTLTKAQSYKGSTTVNAGTLVLNKVNTGSLSVLGGRVNMTVKPTSGVAAATSIVRGLTIAAGGSMDLTNNGLVIDYDALGTQLADLRSQLADSRLFASGLTPSRRLGYRDNSNFISPDGLGLETLSTFGGEAVDVSSLLITPTFIGDTNLDGTVDVADLYNLSLGWLGTDEVWSRGDFNYDGLVNVVDLGLIASNWQAQIGAPFPGSDLVSALSELGLPTEVVPEPSMLALLALPALASGRRRNG